MSSVEERCLTVLREAGEPLLASAVAYEVCGNDDGRKVSGPLRQLERKGKIRRLGSDRDGVWWELAAPPKPNGIVESLARLIPWYESWDPELAKLLRADLERLKYHDDEPHPWDRELERLREQ